jgi:hypothetical protein
MEETIWKEGSMGEEKEPEEGRHDERMRIYRQKARLKIEKAPWGIKGSPEGRHNTE